MRKTRRILFYTHALSGGGAERVWALLASGFARQGHEVIFATDFETGENLEFLDPAVRVVVLGGRHLQNIRRLAELMREAQPDVSLSAIGVSNLKHFLAAVWAGRLARAIQTYHGYFESEPQLLSRIGYLLTPLTSRLFGRTVCVSGGLFRYVRSRFFADVWRTVRIDNPVQWEDDAMASAADMRDRAPVVMAAGRLVDYKNFAFLVRAFAHVQPKNARLVILGEGPEREAIAREIDRLGLQDRVTLAGYQREPWAFYRQARCFALPSKSEAFGLVVVEAMAYGLPVVSTSCHGPMQILQDGRFGAIVDKTDERAMARAITAALADPGDVASRQRRAQDFSTPVAVAKYGELIDELLDCGADARSIADAPANRPAR